MKIFSLMLLLSSLSAITNSQFYNDSWAVIIGINKYQNIRGLNYAVDDANDIKDLLLNKFNFSNENIILLRDQDATKDNILTALYETAEKVGDNDRYMIFFAGHGTQKKLPAGGDKGYLLPVDADTSKLYLTGIDMNIIKDISNETNAKHVLFLMDACYGGLMAINSRGLDTKTPGYMRKITKDKGRQIITAGGKDEEATERTEWGNSAFTKNVIRGLQDEMADKNDDGYITVNELGNYLQIKVTQDSDNAQTPQIRRYGTGEGEFVFTVTPPVVEDVKTDEIAEEKPSTKQTVISMDQFERWMLKNKYIQPTYPISDPDSEISESGGKDSVKEWDLIFGHTAHIDSSDISGKWIKMPSLRSHFNRVDGFGLGLGKTFTRLSPFPYELDMKSQYNFSSKEPNYHLYLKRYLWNREFQYLTASMYQESRTYDDWSVYADGIHQWGSSFLFNVDHFDYYHAQGFSLFYKYYNEDGFSIQSGYKSEKQNMQSKTTDFSVFQYKKKYRENYFSDEDHFTEGTLSSLNIELGFNGAVTEYNWSDYSNNEIIYELDPKDMPLEYELNNYNLINIVSNTLGEPDSLLKDSIFSSESNDDIIQDYDEGVKFGAVLMKRDTSTFSDKQKNALRETRQQLLASISDNNELYRNHINDSLVGIQFVDFSVEDPLGKYSGVRYFGGGSKGQTSSKIYLDNARVEKGKTYIFSFYVRAVQDTITIAPGLSSHNNKNLESKEWADIGTKWKRVWVKKTFEEVKSNPRTYITTSTIEPLYVWGVQLEEVFTEKEIPTEYQSTDGITLEVWLVAESSNWFLDKAEMTNDNNQVYRIQAILPRGRYAYRFEIGGQLMLDPKALKQGKNNNGEDISILEVGLKPKWNLGLEYSDPSIASDFSYKRISSNFRFVLPISYSELLFFRIINGWLSEDAPHQRNFFLGNVGSLRGYGVKEFTGQQMMLINMEYHVNIAHWIGKISTKEKLELSKNIFTFGDKTFLPGLNLKPFVFFDLGIIGTALNEENIYKSAGIGLEFIGIRLMAAKRLDKDENSWSVLFDLGGFFNRWEYLP